MFFHFRARFESLQVPISIPLFALFAFSPFLISVKIFLCLNLNLNLDLYLYIILLLMRCDMDCFPLSLLKPASPCGAIHCCLAKSGWLNPPMVVKPQGKTLHQDLQCTTYKQTRDWGLEGLRAKCMIAVN